MVPQRVPTVMAWSLLLSTSREILTLKFSWWKNHEAGLELAAWQVWSLIKSCLHCCQARLTRLPWYTWE